jgi:hypothetical protein
MKYADIILSDNSHQSSFTSFGVTAGDAVLAAVPFCRELKNPCIVVLFVAVNIGFSLALFEEHAVNAFPRLAEASYLTPRCSLHV